MYYGANDWDGPVSIHEMFDDNVDDRLLQYIPDYKINLLQPSRITDFGHYVTDIGKLFEIISVSEKANGIKELLQAEPERFKNVDNRIIRAINHYTRTEFKVDEEKEATDMCYAMQTSLDEARAEGIEQGVELGTERGLKQGLFALVNLLKPTLTSAEEIRQAIITQPGYEMVTLEDVINCMNNSN